MKELLKKKDLGALSTEELAKIQNSLKRGRDAAKKAAEELKVIIGREMPQDPEGDLGIEEFIQAIELELAKRRPNFN